MSIRATSRLRVESSGSCAFKLKEENASKATTGSIMIFRNISFGELKEKEEESCCPLALHTLDISYAAMIGVFYTSVVTHISYAAVVRVFDASVTADVPHAAVVRVFYTSVAANVSHAAMVGVFHTSVAADVPHAAVVGVFHTSVTANVANG